MKTHTVLSRRVGFALAVVLGVALALYLWGSGDAPARSRSNQSHTVLEGDTQAPLLRGAEEGQDEGPPGPHSPRADAPAIVVRGVVLDYAGRPVRAGYDVRIKIGERSAVVRSVQTDGTGRFRAELDPESTPAVLSSYVFAEALSPDRMLRSSPAIGSTNDPSGPIDLLVRMQRAAIVQLSVVDSGGAPVPSAELLMRRVGPVKGGYRAGHPGAAYPVHERSVADHSGSLTAVVQPGRYYLMARRPAGGWGPAAYHEFFPGPHEDEVVVRAGDAPVTYTLVVKDVRGAPVEGAWITFDTPYLFLTSDHHDTNPRPLGASLYHQHMNHLVFRLTDSAGRLVISSLGSGHDRLRAAVGSPLHLPQVVSIRAGDPMEVTLQDRARVFARLVRTDGTMWAPESMDVRWAARPTDKDSTPRYGDETAGERYQSAAGGAYVDDHGDGSVTLYPPSLGEQEVVAHFAGGVETSAYVEAESGKTAHVNLPVPDGRKVTFLLSTDSEELSPASLQADLLVALTREPPHASDQPIVDSRDFAHCSPNSSERPLCLSGRASEFTRKTVWVPDEYRGYLVRGARSIDSFPTLPQTGVLPSDPVVTIEGVLGVGRLREIQVQLVDPTTGVAVKQRNIEIELQGPLPAPDGERRGVRTALTSIEGIARFLVPAGRYRCSLGWDVAPYYSWHSVWTGDQPARVAVPFR